jgi:molybdopterin molybdotransferase
LAFAERIGPNAEPCAASLSFDGAQAILAAHAHALGSERVRLEKAGRRILAEPVHALIDAPRYDAAAMDGYAVRDADCHLPGLRFRPVGSSYPGEVWTGELGEGEAVRIMTGAQMPLGADRVIVREQAIQADGWIGVAGALPAARHVRARGSDMKAGEMVLPAGRMLDARALLVAAAADASSVVVWRRPRVHVIASGDELVAPGMAASTRCRLPDSLSQAILLMARQWGGVPAGSTLVRDDVAEIKAAAERAVGDSDVLVMAGGASRGDRDFAKLGLAPLGFELAFADIAIKPGKPVWYGRIGDRHVLGLPGNPTAAMTIARLFLAPLLTALGGRGFEAGLRWTAMPLAAETPNVGERETFLCAEWSGAGVRVIERQTASAQCMLARADALVRRPAGGLALAAGELVNVLRF